MLLNNLTKSISVIKKLLPEQRTDQSNLPKKTLHLDNLLEVFVRGDSKKFNTNAEFHFLAGVFANLSVTQDGARFLLGRSTVDASLRLSRIVPYTEHPNLIRRGGVVSTIKNCCFYHEAHEEMLTSQELNLLPFVLLPLCGNEEYTDEVRKHHM